MTASQETINNARAALGKLVQEKGCAPILVRLAWHDAGTYDKNSNTGGPNGSIKFNPEMSHGDNNGLTIAMNLIKPVHEQFADIGLADFIQLAGYAAVEYTGGPKIEFKSGRKDAAEADCTPDGRLPDAKKGVSHLEDIFYRMGFNDQEIVALSGAHTLGRAHKDRSGFEGAWTVEPLKFDNSYFVELLKKEPTEGLLQLPSDKALLEKPEMRKWVETYAQDQAKFFEDYAAAHKKLSELGTGL